MKANLVLKYMHKHHKVLHIHHKIYKKYVTTNKATLYAPYTLYIALTFDVYLKWY